MGKDDISTFSNKEQKDGPTLRELSSSLLCRRIDIGTAILPKPLFMKEKQDDDDNDGTTKMGNATIDCVPTAFTTSSNNEETRYAKIVQSEFNSIVIEVSFLYIIALMFMFMFSFSFFLHEFLITSIIFCNPIHQNNP
jgi:hypothetical protein